MLRESTTTRRPGLGPWVAVALSLIVPTVPLVGAATAQTRDSQTRQAQTEDDRPRPWPDEWPIDLPPIRGPLPPAPPPAPPVDPATSAAGRVMDVLRAVSANLQETSYRHHRVVRERAGVYHWDCSSMTQWVLTRASPLATRGLPETRRALAEDFVRVIERAPTTGFRRGWQRLSHIEQVRPGDVFAWRRPRGFPSRNTGHVGFVVGAPRPVPGIPDAYAISVADATGSGHQNDTRPYEGDGGFGVGTLVFLTDGEGHGTHYGWGGTYSSGYVVTPILFGRVGP